MTKRKKETKIETACNVGQLRQLIADLPDHAEIVLVNDGGKGEILGMVTVELIDEQGDVVDEDRLDAPVMENDGAATRCLTVWTDE